MRIMTSGEIQHGGGRNCGNPICLDQFLLHSLEIIDEI